jgi:hypothetical protein
MRTQSVEGGQRLVLATLRRMEIGLIGAFIVRVPSGGTILVFFDGPPGIPGLARQMREEGRG